MNTAQHQFIVREIVDTSDSRYQAIAGGNCWDGICRAHEHFLRILASMQPGALSASLRMVFQPTSVAGAKQGRLLCYVLANVYRKAEENHLLAVLQRGDLAAFYRIEESHEAFPSLNTMNAICSIVRKEDFITPLHPPELNDRIPGTYCRIESFKANERNNFMFLDGILDGLDEPVIVDICVKPADVSKERLAHTRYLAHLQSINRRWDADDGMDAWEMDDLALSGSNETPSVVKPLRQKDPLADNILRHQQRFDETLFLPHLEFRISVAAQTAATAHLIGATVAHSAFEDGICQLVVQERGAKTFDDIMNAMRAGDVGKRHLRSGNSGPGRFPYPALARFRQLAPVEELLGIFRFPTASHISPLCIRKNTDPLLEDVSDLILLGHDAPRLNATGSTASHIARGVPIKQLAKHAFICGVPGSGKTTAMMNTMIQLHDFPREDYDLEGGYTDAQCENRGIPLLVIESAGHQYRVLKTLMNHPDERVRRLASDLRIYTAGNENVSPFRLNPLWIPPGVSRDEHIERVLFGVRAAIPAPGSLPGLLGEGLEEVYERYPDPQDPPVMAQFVRAAERVLERKHYSGDTNSDFRAAINVRLGSLTRRSIGKVFQCQESTPSLELLMNSCSVIEMSRLSQEEACVLTIFILGQICEYACTHFKPNQGLKFVIFLEEAHNIVGASQDATTGEDIADPKAFASYYVSKMLCEMRSVGVGIVVADQHPSAVSRSVIKNTSTKLAFRLVDDEDRESIGSTMVLTEAQKEDLARQRPGEAFLYREGYHRGRQIQAINLQHDLNYGPPPLDGELGALLHGQEWFQEDALTRTVSELSLLRKRMDEFDKLRLKIASTHIKRRAAALRTEKEHGTRVTADLVHRARESHNELTSAYETFVRGPYRALLGSNAPAQAQELRTALKQRFETIIKPEVEASLSAFQKTMKAGTTNMT